MTTHSSILAEKVHDQKSLEGYSSGCKESEVTEYLRTHTQTLSREAKTPYFFFKFSIYAKVVHSIFVLLVYN